MIRLAAIARRLSGHASGDHPASEKVAKPTKQSVQNDGDKAFSLSQALIRAGLHQFSVE